MSAKASVKSIAAGSADSTLFKWVAVLTGSKNALKGFGFFVGAGLLEWIGFRSTLGLLAGLLLLVLIVTAVLLPSAVGKMKTRPKFSEVFSRIPALNWLSAARFFLFGSRDVWFVVGLPVFLYEMLGWNFTSVGAFLATWIIGYGFVQALSPQLLRRQHHGKGPNARSARFWVITLALLPAGIAFSLGQTWPSEIVLIVGLLLFGIVFAINSAVHSYLVLAYSDHDRVSLNVGFYYMSNAAGRLAGTVLSGWVYQTHGLEGCLWWSSGFVAIAALISMGLPELESANSG